MVLSILLIMSIFYGVSKSRKIEIPDAYTGATGIVATDGIYSFQIQVPQTSTQWNNYAMASWVTDELGNFVKTLQVNTINEENALVNWQNTAGGNKLDAISGATMTNVNRTMIYTWNCKDPFQNLKPDGFYNVWVEYASTRNTSTAPNQLFLFTFNKGECPTFQVFQPGSFFMATQVSYQPKDAPNQAIEIKNSTPKVCAGTQVTLSAVGGKTGSYGSWNWYKDSQLTQKTASGATVKLTVFENISYYLLAETNVCPKLTPVSTHIQTNMKSESANSIQVSPQNIFVGNNVTLTVVGGKLGTNGNWFWYLPNNLVTPLQMGTQYSFNINQLTTIMVRAKDDCTVTDFTSISINPQPSLIDNQAKKYYNIFPNPATDFLQIESSENEPITVEFLNTYGEKIEVFYLNHLSNRILDISNLSPGVYFIKITSLKSVFFKKILKI